MLCYAQRYPIPTGLILAQIGVKPFGEKISGDKTQRGPYKISIPEIEPDLRSPPDAGIAMDDRKGSQKP